MTGSEGGLFKKAESGDWVFGVVENGKIVVAVLDFNMPRFRLVGSLLWRWVTVRQAFLPVV